MSPKPSRRPDGQIESCIRSEYARLVGAVSMVTQSVELAEEAVQEAFAKAWERDRSGESFDHLAGWVATVALNHARSGLRKRRNERHTFDRLRSAAATGTADPQVATQLVVRDAVAELGGRQRDAVVLYYLLDLDVATTARLLEVSPGTVKTALSRARTKLAAALLPNPIEEDAT